eukprot:TRINITY_DN64092_c0_g1_i2.p1 TRINITY_DN64092_c0_g1~~TRINITY_DN64092_c0_g1_i2.p1  ORF type:complete len:311 (-),score=1.57 TRINITY_DN64092_c0_g1_i2:215-1147(-)
MYQLKGCLCALFVCFLLVCAVLGLAYVPKLSMASRNDLIQERQVLYLVQTEDGLTSIMRNALPGDTLCLSWKRPSPPCIFLPNSTWTEGRNALLLLAKSVPQKYTYYTFLDDDVTFTRQQYKQWQDFLFQYRPAVGTPFVPGHVWHAPPLPGVSVQTTKFFDAVMNAFHIDIVNGGLLLPYYDGEDDVSWWRSQICVVVLANILYPDQILQFNNLTISNKVHRQYPKEKFPRQSSQATCQAHFFKSKQTQSPSFSWDLEVVQNATAVDPPLSPLHLPVAPDAMLLGAFNFSSPFWRRTRAVLQSPLTLSS